MKPSDWYHLLPFLRQHSGQALALVTLVQVEGSSYRHVGARLVVNACGEFSGSLSGGCLEERMSELALLVIEEGGVSYKAINTDPIFGCPGVLRRPQPKQLPLPYSSF